MNLLFIISRNNDNKYGSNLFISSETNLIIKFVEIWNHPDLIVNKRSYIFSEIYKLLKQFWSLKKY